MSQLTLHQHVLISYMQIHKLTNRWLATDMRGLRTVHLSRLVDADPQI